MENNSDVETTSEIDITESAETKECSNNIRPELERIPFDSSTNQANNYAQKPSELRHKINMRERKRMHDLNVAMDSLREVMPYANGPSVRKLSKIATLSLARNYIQMLTKSVEEMKQLLDEIYRDSVNTRMQGHWLPSIVASKTVYNPITPKLPTITKCISWTCWITPYELLRLWVGAFSGTCVLLGTQKYLCRNRILWNDTRLSR